MLAVNVYNCENPLDCTPFEQLFCLAIIAVSTFVSMLIRYES